MDGLMSKKSDDAIIKEAHREFAECEDREYDARKLWKSDLRFANGDPENGYQWSEELKKSRELDPNGARPCLTTNKVKQHNRQITNDVRQNKPAIRVSPVDDKADKKTAEILNGVIRHIEKNSSADTAYDIAGEFAVDAGLGYWRVTTDYAADDSFEQEIYIKAIPNPLNVYLGSHTEPDGSDATCGFVFEDIAKAEFEARYPDADAIGWPTDEGTDWISKETIRVAEYFKITEDKDTLFADEQGNTVLLSAIEDQEEAKRIKADESIKKRTVSKKRCKWYLIAGDKILDSRDWPGKYIPIVRVVGEEVLIDGKIDRKGHTRAMKDAQRMYNYWSSAAVEYGALQGKQPYMAPAEAIAGYESHWDNLNKSHASYVPYNAFDEAGNPVPMPQRQMPPVTAPMYMEGMRVANEEMKMASGQYDAAMGQRSNETSGRAINARQQESDNATFHFIDNIARAVRYTGRVLIDLIPKVYDTPRIMRILGEDGTEDRAQIDPGIPNAYQEQRDDLTGEIRKIYNPSVGRYDVDVRVGPSYGSRRQEAFQALNEISSRNPQLMAVAGDLVFKAADFPMAEEIAERLQKTLPPNLQDEKDGEQQIPPEVQAQIQQMQEQMQMMQQAGQQLQAELQQRDMQDQSKMAAAAADAQLKRDIAETASRDALMQAERDAQVELEKAAMANETKLKTAAMDAVVKVQIAGMQQQEPEIPVDAPMVEPAPDHMAEAMERIAQAMEAMRQPRRVVRDEAGNMIGVE